MNKPNNITSNDWKLLTNLYSNNLEKVIKKINKGYPIQYLIGFVDFFDCQIKVNKNVLIPRFETEQLVDYAIKKIGDKFNIQKINILDCGTGSGCIAIKLKQAFNQSNVIAIDKSKKALTLAIENANINNVDIIFNRCSFKKVKTNNIDVIISNPPYISKNELIEQNVKKYEPKKALYASKNGLKYYEQIIKNSLLIINKEFLIILEIGANQAQAISQLILKYYPNANIEIIKDFNKLDRIIVVSN